MKNVAMTAECALNEVTSHKDAIVKGNTKVHPGQSLSLANLVKDDVLPQGDLYIRVCGPKEQPPKDYIKTNNPTGAALKLVPGPDAGSHHWLDSGEGVTIWMPPEWGNNLESLRGPWISTTQDRCIEHRGPSKHGSIQIAAGQIIELGYQRVWDQESRQERRARD